MPVTLVTVMMTSSGQHEQQSSNDNRREEETVTTTQAAQGHKGFRGKHACPEDKVIHESVGLRKTGIFTHYA